MRGRLVAQWTALIWEAIFLFIFSQINVLGGAIACLIMFSLGVQMSEGTSYGEILFHPPPLPLAPCHVLRGMRGQLSNE